MATTDTIPRPSPAPQQAAVDASAITPDPANFLDDSIRQQAQAMVDAARQMLEDLADDPTNAARASAMLREAEAARAAVPKTGAVPRSVADRVSATSRAISAACIESTSVTTRAHATEKAIIAEGSGARQQRQREQDTILSRILDVGGAREEQRHESATRPRVHGALLVGAVVQATRQKSRTAANVAGMMLGGTLSNNRDMQHEAIRVGVFGLRNTLEDIGVDEDIAQDIAHAAHVGARTVVAADVARDTLWHGAGKVMTGQGGEEEAQAMGRGSSRSLQRFGMAEDDAEAVGRVVTGTFMTGANASRATAERVDEARRAAERTARQAAEAAENARRAAARAAKDARDVVSDRMAGVGAYGRLLAGAQVYFNGEERLKARFDTDRDGTIELHEIRNVLKDRYHIDSVADVGDRNGDGKIDATDVLLAVAGRPKAERQRSN